VVKRPIEIAGENQILGVEELVYITYLIMIHNVEQVLLKAFFSAFIVAHGPVEMSFAGFCCKQNKAIFIFSVTLFGNNVSFT